MVISDRAIEHMEMTAQAVGFGPRDDYPYRSASPLSAADWKGHSIAACVFAGKEQAREYLDKALSELDALGSGPKGRILTVSLDYGDERYVAVITAIDLVHASEIVDRGEYEEYVEGGTK